MADGLFTVDLDGTITFWNKGAERITGYTAEDVIGKNCDILEGDNCLGTNCVDGIRSCGLFEKGEVSNNECTIRTKDGHFVTLLKNARVLRDKNGNIIGGVENLTDITNLKRAQEEVRLLRRELRERHKFEGIIGKDARMQEVYNLIEDVAPTSASVLIFGESGTGKELVASALHFKSLRADGPFVKLNCAALSENLLESELFGHVRGAFTGAIRDKIGRFELANGGTLFLDEIGDISLNVQVKLLRALQEKVIERVGDIKPLHVDVRIIAATHQDLRQLMKEGTFRDDLYYRLKVVSLFLPPLSERKDDIPLLVEHFIQKFRQQTGKPVGGINPDALRTLMSYAWPGNIRELENAIEHAFVLAKSRIITPDLLPIEISPCPVCHATDSGTPSVTGTITRETLQSALAKAGWNKAKAARLLGVTRTTVWRNIKKYGLHENPSAEP
ncbi:MAG: PAS domain S-box protein [Candidatus Abyssobacteria bacterium SURF_5]|uniref:PAS domain S-box protein n=1 Tax=Abyssobacteria bacterium (strain SURF_5) TaxID=2093360 RepID=A0A3A4P3I9_ABYX5|nr:MAG: PAS domain S-box protein [Candidatus Abyssubacteria bacterium SURF_5]